jgi:glycolate oxidase FAD binding subunit
MARSEGRLEGRLDDTADGTTVSSTVGAAGGAAEESTARDALAATGVAIRDAGPDDAVAGVRPRWVALPESTEELAAVLRAAAGLGLAVLPVGGGTKAHWGRPAARCDLLVDTCCLNEILEHAAGDLVVRVQAGVTMEALAAALAAEGQELALDVPIEGATVGGTLATATAGPRRFRYGTARDLLIGVTVVLADGTIAKSGGKVVKNVAGYDLGKLFTGSYGTLGVIAEATFRLHPLAPERRWVTVECPPLAADVTDTHDVAGNPLRLTRPRPHERLRRLAEALAAAQAEPSAIEFDWPSVTGPVTVSTLVEGAAAAQRAQAVHAVVDEVAGAGDAAEHGPARRAAERAPALAEGPAGPAEEAAEGPAGPAGGSAGRGERAAERGEGTDRPSAQVSDEAPPWWGRPPGDEVLFELRSLPADAGRLLAAVAEAARAARVEPRVRGALASGCWQLSLPADTEAGDVAVFVSRLRDDAEARQGRLIVLAAPQEIARRVDRHGRIGALALMNRVKERFDPERRMSPGRSVGGL